MVLSMVTGQMAYMLTTDSIVHVLVTLGIWAFYGVGSYNDGNEFGREELKDWYILETGRLEDQEKREKNELEGYVDQVKEYVSDVITELNEKKTYIELLEKENKQLDTQVGKTLEKNYTFKREDYAQLHTYVSKLFDQAKHDKDGWAKIGIVNLKQILNMVKEMDESFILGVTGEKGLSKGDPGIKLGPLEPKTELEVKSDVIKSSNK